jgi:hypothetical protein
MNSDSTAPGPVGAEPRIRTIVVDGVGQSSDHTEGRSRRAWTVYFLDGEERTWTTIELPDGVDWNVTPPVGSTLSMESQFPWGVYAVSVDGVDIFRLSLDQLLDRDRAAERAADAYAWAKAGRALEAERERIQALPFSLQWRVVQGRLQGYDNLWLDTYEAAVDVATAVDRVATLQAALDNASDRDAVIDPRVAQVRNRVPPLIWQGVLTVAIKRFDEIRAQVPVRPTPEGPVVS